MGRPCLDAVAGDVCHTAEDSCSQFMTAVLTVRSALHGVSRDFTSEQ